ncbi:hypothetical protein FGADI_1873 [Fusarium gaditjirri]|uniref:C2H2-type domain-containing protein n=1 Tax=Fusarium gaditjirri TaxID=282569 RepID=A0A8H4X1Z1_9HYPO|nr:hypothetical protein FGADI_1873 [Fusarium gaditjirri]
MANPQLDHEQDDEGELKCLRQTESRRAQSLSGRYLWTSDTSVDTPVAESSNHQKVPHWPGRAWAGADMGIHGLPKQAVDSKYDTPPRRCQAGFPSSVSPSDYVKNNSPSITAWRLAKDRARNDSLPNPAPGSESKMMVQPETRPISQEQLVAEVRGIYAGLAMVETKCFEVDNAQFTEGRFNFEEWQQLLTHHLNLLYEDDDPFNISSTKESQDYELGELLSELSLRSRSFCRLNIRLLPLLQAKKGTPSSAYEELKCRNASTQIIFEFPNNMRHVCTTMPWTILPALLVLWGVCWMFINGPGDLEPEKFKAPAPTFSPAPAVYDFLDDLGPAYYEHDLQSVPMPEPSATGYDQHPTVNSLLFNEVEAGIDPIYLVQVAPQDADFFPFDVLPRNSAGITETPAKEDLTGALPAAVAPDRILQASGDANRQEPFNPPLNVVLAGQRVQNAGSNQKRKSCFTCPQCQQTFATSFTLSRHQIEAHKDVIPSPEESFPCPNRGYIFKLVNTIRMFQPRRLSRTQRKSGHLLIQLQR